ncbi:MAG: TlpA disulfide reductase family protein [Tissierellaceae bacterium]
MKKISLVILFVLIGAILLTGCVKDKTEPVEELPVESGDVLEEDQNEGEDEGEEEVELQLAPVFTLKNLDGEEVSLEDYRGKKVLLNFWATWCKFCDQEMPDLQKFDSENDDIVVVAVNSMEKKANAQKYIEDGNYEFDVLLDEDGEISRMYYVSGLPTSYFIDEEGYLLGGVPGAINYDQMMEILEGIREY